MYDIPVSGRFNLKSVYYDFKLKENIFVMYSDHQIPLILESERLGIML